MTYNDHILTADFVMDMRDQLPRHPSKKWQRRDPSKIKGVVLHQSLEDFGTASGNAKYHVGPNHISSDGLPALSYTLFVDRKLGQVVLANDVEDVPYSQGDKHIPGDENELYLSVCWGGNFPGPGYNPSSRMSLTESQRKLVRPLWEHLKAIFDLKNNQLFGHYHFGKVACPGTELMGEIEMLRQGYYSTYAGVDFDHTTSRQEALQRLGYYHGAIDGQWGPQSKYALTQFQKAAGINVDGVWGPVVEAAIVEALG